MILLINQLAWSALKEGFPASNTAALPFNDTTDTFFSDLFMNNPGKFDSVVLHRIGWNVQVIYTQVNWNNSQPSFERHYYNKEDARYFYPGTALNLPVAILALQKLHELPFPSIDMNTSMITEAAYSGQTAQYNDPAMADGRPTVAGYIKKMFLQNDYNAFNRLYEFLGQEYINKQLSVKGYKTGEILQRLGKNLTEDENRHTNTVSFYNKTIMRPVYEQPMQNNTSRYEKRNDFIGRGYDTDTGLVYAPMNFSQMNRLSLSDLDNIMISLLFPGKVKPEQRFNITEEDRRFLLKYMSQQPGETTYPLYDSADSNSFAKYIYYGGAKKDFSKNIRVFNVTGKDYGQLTDIAYVVDFDKMVCFVVSATIYCNKDEILDDDHYDYETIGLPFMKDLGQALYNFELKRKKRISAADLAPVNLTYDK